MPRHTPLVNEKKALIVTLADIKAEVEAKSPGEMHGDLQKRALVTVHMLKKVQAETFSQTLGDMTEKALVYRLTDPIPCTGGALVNTLA